LYISLIKFDLFSGLSSSGDIKSTSAFKKRKTWNCFDSWDKTGLLSAIEDESSQTLTYFFDSIPLLFFSE
jgi:hypothetical protein